MGLRLPRGQKSTGDKNRNFPHSIPSATWPGTGTTSSLALRFPLDRLGASGCGAVQRTELQSYHVSRQTATQLLRNSVTQAHPLMSKPWFPFLQFGADDEPALPAARIA